MKIGTCVSFDDVQGMEEKVRKLKENGFSCCQMLSFSPCLWTEENAANLKTLFAAYGVEITLFWAGWEGPMVWNFTEGPLTLGLVPEEYRAMRVKNLCAGSDFARWLGVEDVATHMGFIPENPNDPQFIPFCDAVRKVARHCKKNGQHLLFESGQETPVTLLRCFETVREDNLGVNFDTANVILYGKANPVDALDVVGKYVRNVHAKDGLYPTNGHELGREVKLGTGKVDFPAFLKKLYALGYDGALTIEREIEGDEQTADILESRMYLETILQTL